MFNEKEELKSKCERMMEEKHKLETVSFFSFANDCITCHYNLAILVDCDLRALRQCVTHSIRLHWIASHNVALPLHLRSNFQLHQNTIHGIALHGTASHDITSHPITLYRIASHHIISDPITCVLLSFLQTVKKLEEENAKRSGHQNQQQKINYLLSIKRENNELQKVITFFLKIKAILHS